MRIGKCDDCGVTGVLVYIIRGEPTRCFPCYAANQRKEREDKLKGCKS